MESFDKIIVGLLAPLTGRPAEEMEPTIELPAQLDHGDRAVPCFRFAKELKASPQEVANRFKNELTNRGLPTEIARLEAMGGYLNFFLNREILAAEVLRGIAAAEGRYGFIQKKDPPIAVVEFSAPNIAKPFSIGHLRSTNIGAAIARIFAARGWKVIKINHLGDWGTQFGKLMAAYRRWGHADLLTEEPIQNLYKLYVRFHEEEVSDTTLIEEAREWFARLERGDEEAKELWTWFRDLSLIEFKALYKRLGVEFDHYWGESFYTEHLPAILEELESKNLTKVSDNATIINLEEYNLGVSVVKKSDDSSLYITRDLAAAIYRHKKLHFDRMIYVVGNPQQLHFKQLFKILELLGYTWAADCEHVSFGHISFGDEAMSTRKGNVVFLSEVLDRAMSMAKKVVQEKNPDLENQDQVAQAVGLGAILFADVSAKRIKDIRFSWEEMLSFDGETGPYLQYTLVRTLSVLRKFDQPVDPKTSTSSLTSDEEAAVVRQLATFPTALARAERDREPFLLAQYLIGVAKVFNRFYSVHRILEAPEETRRARMLLVASVADILRTGLSLLGIPILEKM